MSNAVITSILARGLSDARFLEGVLQDPAEGLREYDLDDATLAEFRGSELSRLADIRGFIAKVKHNQLWQDFPYTRIVLRRFGYELAAFRAYSGSELAPHHRSASTPRTRIRQFIEFLDRYLAERPEPHAAVILSVLRHEKLRKEIIDEIKAGAGGGRHPRPPITRGVWERETAVPIPRGALRFAEVEFDPLELVRLIPGSDLTVDQLERRRRWLIYFCDFQNPDLQVLEVPPASALLLSLVDGNRTVAAIRRAFRDEAGCLSPEATLAFFSAAAEVGLVAASGG